MAAALRSAGFHVVDLGVNVTPEAFVESTVREKAQVLAISISVNETVPLLRQVVDLLRKGSLKGNVKTIIGGGAVSLGTAEQYEIDAYAKDQFECVEKVRRWLTQQISCLTQNNHS